MSVSSINKAKKKEAVQEISERISNSNILLFCDFRGTDVLTLTNFRRELLKEEGKAKVFKNTLIRRALDDAKIEYPKDFIIGPTAIISGETDPVKIAKFIKSFTKKNETIKVKGGIFENAVIDGKQIEELSKLPSTDELRAMVIGRMKSPITGFIQQTASPIRGIVYVLNALKNKKSEEE